MDAAGELAQVVDGALELLGRRGQLVPQLGRRVRGRGGLACLPERDRHGDQPLLRPVVEVAFHPPALLLGGDARRARDAFISSSCACSAASSRSFSTASRRTAITDPTSAGSSRSTGSWTIAASGAPVVLQQRHRVRVVIDRRGDRPPSAAVQPPPDGSGRTRRSLGIAQRSRERRLEADGGRHRSQPDGERHERAARPAQPERADDEARPGRAGGRGTAATRTAPPTPPGSASSGSPVAVPYAVSAASNAAALIATMPATRIGHITWRTIGRLPIRPREADQRDREREDRDHGTRDGLDREERIRRGGDRERVGRQAGVGRDLRRVLEQQPRGAADEECSQHRNESQRPSPVGSRAGSESTSTANATS